MILNVVVILLVGFIAYMWATQGFLSAFLHMCCTIAAGAVAFGLWEPLVYGVLLSVRPDLAWTFGLALPFLISLVVFRLACDKLIQWDVKVDDTTNFIGGGVFGLVSGTVSAGIIVIACGFLNMGPALFGYQPVGTTDNGSVVKKASMWYPADTITAKIFESLSVGGFSAGDNALAYRQPDVHLQSGLVRATSREVSRTTILPQDLNIEGFYLVEGSFNELVTDTFQIDSEGSPMRQTVVRFDGHTRPEARSKLYGTVLSFRRGGVESTGQFVIGPNQLKLVCKLDSGATESFYPISVISRADATTLTAGRWRFDAPDIFVASASQADKIMMSFEFLIPSSATPVDLLVKNTRVPTSTIPPMAGVPAEGMTIEARDDAIRNMSILVGAPVSDAVGIPRGRASGATSTGSPSVNTTNLQEVQDSGVRITALLPSGVLHKSSISGFEYGGRDGLMIVRGKSRFQDAAGTSAPTSLRISRLVEPKDTRIIQVDISIRKAGSPYGMARQKGLTVVPPVLIDQLGQVYEACGFYHNDGLIERLEFDPARSIRALSELPSLSSSKPNDQVVLFFIVPKGVQIREFSLGGQETLIKLDPPLPV